MYEYVDKRLLRHRGIVNALPFWYRKQITAGGADVLTTRQIYNGWMIVHLYLRTSGSGTSSRLVGRGPQWVVEPRGRRNVHIRISRKIKKKKYTLKIEIYINSFPSNYCSSVLNIYKDSQVLTSRRRKFHTCRNE